MSLTAARTGVFVLADGAAWEADVVPALGAAGLAVVRRCVDVSDLMAAAGAGQARVALVGAEVSGLDTEAVLHLLRHDVRTVAVASGTDVSERLGRIGVVEVVSPQTDLVVAATQRAATSELVPDPAPEPPALDPDTAGTATGRVLAVWGPTGAPGRTTVALGLAAVRAADGHPVVLLDLDPYGGAAAQHLGVLDEVSGVLAAARLANDGQLDAAAFAGCARRIDEGLTLLTGLPRADRRVEVRSGVVERLVGAAAGFGDVVLDTGFCLEEDGSVRDRMSIDALLVADEVVVVGSAEPTGLARLARGLVEVAELLPGVAPHVVVNRMRGSLGWSERDIVGMVEGYVRPAGVTFLPFDQQVLDRALVAGRTLVEVGDSALRQAVSGLASAAFDDGPAVPARTRRSAQPPKRR